MAVHRRGAEAHVTNDALHITDMVEAFDPGLVRLDLSLPHIDGFEACRLIRQAKGAGPYIAALTGCTGAAQKERCGRAGFDLHLNKPASMDGLFEVGRIALRRATRG